MLRKRLWESSLFFMLLASLLFNVNVPARAQGGGGDGEEDEDEVLVEITGKIELAGRGGIVVDGVTVAPAGAFDPSTLEAGACVIVTGRLLKSDVLQATELEVSEDGSACLDDDDGDDGGDDGDDADDESEDDEDEGEDEDDEGEGTGCERLDHPVLTAFSDTFKVDYEDLAAYHCDGVGLGEIGRALMLAEAAGADYEGILKDRADGMGWGAIKKEYDIKPGDLAPGRVISAYHHDSKDDGSDTPPGLEDKDKDNPGHGGTPPGLDDAGKEDNPGHGGTPPGLDDKDDKDNPGHGGTPPGLGDTGKGGGKKK
jgi:hypothetical protein